MLGAEHTGREPKLTGPYKETDPFHEPLVTYAYLAGITKKLELVTGVIGRYPQRDNVMILLSVKAGLRASERWTSGRRLAVSSS